MNIIINGGTQGIGFEVAIKLAQNTNNQIIVTGRNLQSMKDLSSRFSNISTMKLDLADFENYSESLKQFVHKTFDSVDVLINMAGLMISKDFVDISSNEARMIIETNFIGPAFFIRVLKPFMSNGSHILNISSMGGFQGSEKYKGLSYYSASKAAIACLSECLANEFREDHINVNCLALGSVQTEMLQKAFPGYKAPVTALEMAEFISDFAVNGHKFFNGKILPVAVNNP